MSSLSITPYTDLVTLPQVPDFGRHDRLRTRRKRGIADRELLVVIEVPGLLVRGDCGLDYDTLGRAARIHGLRHTFVLRTLLNWYREDADVEAQLPLLSTFLGHVEPSTTYWYFEAAPQLLSLAAERLERTWEEQS